MGVPAPIGISASGNPPAGDQASAVATGTLLAVGPGDPFAMRGPMNLMIWASLTALAFTTTNGSTAASVSAGTGMAVGGAINSVNVPAGTTWKTFAGVAGTLALPAVALTASNMSTSSTNITLAPGSNVARLLGASVTVASSRLPVTLPANTTVAAIVQLDIPPSLNSPGQPGIVALSAAPTFVGPIAAAHHLRFQLTPSSIVTGVDASAIFTGASVVFVGTVQIERSFDGASTWLPCNIGNTGTLAAYTAGTPVSLTFGEPEREVYYRLNCLAYTSGIINYRISQTGGANESLAVGPLSGG